MGETSLSNTFRWVVYRGFQDDYKALYNFPTEADAEAYVEAQGWSLTKSDPVTPAVWIQKELHRRVR